MSSVCVCVSNRLPLLLSCPIISATVAILRFACPALLFTAMSHGLPCV